MIYIAYQLIYFIWILLSNRCLSVLISRFDTHVDYSMFDYYTNRHPIVHNKVQALFIHEDVQYLQYNTYVFIMKPADSDLIMKFHQK